MAFIRYIPADELSPDDRVPDEDHILAIHGIHPRVIRLHYDLYAELMHGPGPLRRTEREMVAVLVSALNQCHY